MFLRELRNETKELFLDLSIYAAMVDGILHEKEKRAINEYCFELQILEVRYKPLKRLDDVLSEIKAICNTSEINIMIVEILSILISDDSYDNTEKAFVKKLKNAFDLSDQYIEDIYQKLISLKKMIYDLYAVIY